MTSLAGYAGEFRPADWTTRTEIERARYPDVLKRRTGL
jgi:hypothetical protein